MTCQGSCTAKKWICGTKKWTCDMGKWIRTTKKECTVTGQGEQSDDNTGGRVALQPKVPESEYSNSPFEGFPSSAGAIRQKIAGSFFFSDICQQLIYSSSVNH
jgi:hypothetical protein